MSTTRRAVGVLLIAALAGTACGGSKKEATTTADVSTETTAASLSESTAASGGGVGDFGDLAAVCGPGSAKGATEQGVTDSQIVVGTISDAGNTIIPGLNQELFDAADAFVGWCNEAGGILGRRIVLNKRDACLLYTSPSPRD